MAARAKRKPEPAQIDLEEAIAATFDPAALIREYHELDAHIDLQTKAFGEYLKPTRTRIEEIRSTLHAKALEQKVNGFPTDEGTAYLSVITSHKIDSESAYTNAEGRVSTGRDAVLDWALDNWDDYGSEGVTINVLKAVVDRWREEHDNKPPPGLKLDTMVRLNIKKS
jgi:hypothetical protein